MPLTTGILTAIYGGYDTPKPLPADHGFDQAVMVTDRDLDAPGWDVVVLPTTHHPRMAAKVPKCLPHLFLDTDRTLWIDGSYSLVEPMRDAVDEHLERHDVVAFAHPDRATRPDAYAEARFTHDHYADKYQPRDKLLEQTEHYRTQGLPEGSGLYACGAIARRHTREVETFGRAWLLEQATWTVQDQVSFPYVAWALGVDVGTWDHEQWHNPWLLWCGHLRDD